ncbi:hypothetical protein N431DRAFT_563277 [Stipitochalara longipes BDJ]|nr:hypothetical protein N431DRAFT_563277 [Stipitochalara longipes BDJ]
MHINETTIIHVNTGSLSSTPIKTPQCCFVVQDYISEVLFQQFHTSNVTAVMNMTSFTTVITRFQNVVLTSVGSFVSPETEVSASTLWPVYGNPFGYRANHAPHPPVSTTRLQNQTQIVTAGVTVASPTVFFVYSTIKIITVAPVTAANGQVVCGTVWTSGDWSFSNVNSNAQAYFGGSNIAQVITASEQSSLIYLNSAGSTIDTGAARSSGLTITLATPFIYTPTKTYDRCTGTNTEALGAVPQTLIQHILTQPALSSQYPGLESCFLAIPSVIAMSQICPPWPVEGWLWGLPGDTNRQGPTVESAGGKLTESITTSTALAFLGGNAVPVAQPATVVSQTAEGPTTSTFPVPAMVLTTSTVVVTSVTPSQAAVPAEGLVQSIIASIIEDSPLGPSVLISGRPQFVISASVTIPAPAGLAVSGLTRVISGITNVVVSSARTVPASEVLQSLPGSTTMLSGTLEVVILGPTIVAVNSQLPELTGKITVISSSTFILVPTATTVPVVLPAQKAASGPTEVTALSAEGGVASSLEEQITASDQRTSGGKTTKPPGKNTKSSSECRLGIGWNVIVVVLSIVVLGYC